MSEYAIETLINQDPSQFYERTFEVHKARPAFGKVLGALAVRATSPELFFPDGTNANEYHASLEGKPAIVLFNHPGKSELHDPIAALTAVYLQPDWRRRVDEFRVWVKPPILQHRLYRPVTERLGCQLVARQKEFPDKDIRNKWNNALFDSTRKHMNEYRGSVAIFPEGTRGGTEIRPGAGIVAEGLDDRIGAVIVPIALMSDRINGGSIPKNLKISYGEIIPVQAGISSYEYTQLITDNMATALALAA